MLKFIKLFSLFCFILVYSNISADTTTINKTIDWEQYNSHIELNIENNIPCINFIFEERISGEIKDFNISDQTYIPTSKEEQIKYKNLENINIPYLFARKQTIRKKDIIETTINPFRINPINGNLEKLSSFRLEVITKNINRKTKSVSYPSNSMLSTGDWFKIRVDTTGVFMLTYEELVAIGISDPGNVRLYGYGGKQLSYINEISFHDDMHENPIYMNKGADGVFNSGDYILFFGQNTTTWDYISSEEMFIQDIHKYSKHTYYFLTSSFGEGKKIETATPVTAQENYNTNSTDSYHAYEVNNFNPIHSGRTWYGDKLNRNEKRTYSFIFPNFIPGSEAKYITQAVSTASSSSGLNISINGSLPEYINMNSHSTSYRWGYFYKKKSLIKPASNTISFDLTYSSSSYSSECYLDYICVNTKEYISLYYYPQLLFRDVNSVGNGNISKFNISNASINTVVWDITDPTTPINISLDINGSSASFKYETNELKEFIAFNGTSFFKPSYSGLNLGRIANQNLHSLSDIDYLIVTHPLFIDYANELAELHKSQSGLNVYVTTPDLIYNEFSSGMPDVTAIRNFSKMLYNKSPNYKYLLLYGDGTYDNLHNIIGNSNFILTYQSKESLYELYSYTSDDYFGLLDLNEGENQGKIDIGIGRLPAKSTLDAKIMNDKIKSYMADKSNGSWKNNICFIGDDDDGNVHMAQPDEISKWLNTNKPAYNINKIFMDAYPRISSPSGFRYPGVTTSINEAVTKGALIIDYVGHGNKRKLAHEEILTVTEVNSWKNYDKLSVFVTASCEVGRYDNYSIVSLGESFILAPNGGGVAALTTTRVVYSGENHNLNKNFFYNALNPDYTLGDILRVAKNNTPGDINKRNFSLLGDPALKLSVPALNAKIEYINNYYVTDNFTPVDTLKALSKAIIAGIITDQNGNKQEDANGTINITVFDKQDSIVCLGQTTTPAFSFKLQDKIIYKGQASVTNGEFEFEFLTPKDINFRDGTGKISLIANTSAGLANGFTSSFTIGGINNNAEEDYAGPEISLYMNDTNFVNGGLTNENPVLLAMLSDENGINTTGNGIGHNITAIIDDDYSNPINLNSFYEGSIDKFNCGEINYPFYSLDPGLHTIEFKVWDIHNNSTTTTIDFIVAPETSVQLNNLRNAPNPFSDETFFMFNHNQSEGIKEVTINVFSLMGEKVSEIKAYDYNENFNITPIRWDGTGFNGNKLPKGIYIYNAVLKNSAGQISTQTAKTLIF